MRSLLLLIAVFSAHTLLSQTPDAANLQQKRAALQKEMDQLKQSLDDIRKNKKAGLRELAIVQDKVRLREEHLQLINREINLIQGRINNSQYEIARLAGELDTLKQQYKKSIVYSYQHKSNLEFLNFVFSANSFNDGLKRIEYLKSYRKYREEQAAAIRNTQAILNQKIDGLQINRRQKDAVLDEQEKEMKLFAKDKQEKNKIVASLKARENQLLKELAVKEKAEKKLRSGIDAAIRGEKNKVRTKTSGLAFEKSKGSLPMPVEGRITEKFGRYKVPGVEVWGHNYGITIEMETGAAVQSVFDGEVLRIFDVDGRSAIIITHGKYYTTYSNLQNVTVQKGQQVEKGQAIAKSAANDYGKGQIIFMLTDAVNNTNLDPEKWLKKR